MLFELGDALLLSTSKNKCQELQFYSVNAALVW